MSPKQLREHIQRGYIHADRSEGEETRIVTPARFSRMNKRTWKKIGRRPEGTLVVSAQRGRYLIPEKEAWRVIKRKERSYPIPTRQQLWEEARELARALRHVDEHLTGRPSHDLSMT